MKDCNCRTFSLVTLDTTVVRLRARLVLHVYPIVEVVVVTKKRSSLLAWHPMCLNSVRNFLRCLHLDPRWPTDRLIREKKPKPHRLSVEDFCSSILAKMMTEREGTICNKKLKIYNVGRFVSMDGL